MNKEEFDKEMLELSSDLDIKLNVEQLEQFYKYMNLLIQWNEKINLTAIIEPKEIILKHFIDSITISKYLEKNQIVIDVGTGAGFPGIPVAILNTESKVILLDSLNKRINFLNKVIKEDNLKNIETIHARVEEFGKNKKFREKYDVATSRAVANLSVLAEYMLPLVKLNGVAICMKASNIEDEIKNSKRAIEILGGKIEMVEEFVLPNSDIKRSIIIIRKVKSTPAQYPRKPGTPSKEPL